MLEEEHNLSNFFFLTNYKAHNFTTVIRHNSREPALLTVKLTGAYFERKKKHFYHLFECDLVNWSYMRIFRTLGT